MATVPKPTPTMTDEQMLRAIPEQFMQYHDKRNIDGLVNLFTDDGRIMVPFHPLAEGRTALREAFQRVFDEFDQRSLKVETTHVEVSGNTAFCIGTFKVNVKLPTGKRFEDHGKWLAGARRVGTTWKIAAHCWNSNLPITSFTT